MSLLLLLRVVLLQNNNQQNMYNINSCMKGLFEIKLDHSLLYNKT